MTFLSYLGVGGPHVFTGDGWDPAPLVLATTIVALMWAARLPIRGLALLAALVGALLLDILTDVWRVSFATALAAVGIAFAIVALRRMRSA